MAKVWGEELTGGVIQELGAGIAFDVMGVKVSPPQLHIQPVLVGGFLVERVVLVCHQAGLGHGPLERRKQEDVGAGGVHLVRFARVDGLLLHRLDLQGVQLLVEHLAQVHDQRLVDLLPQMGAEDLNQRDLQGGDLHRHGEKGRR